MQLINWTDERKGNDLRDLANKIRLKMIIKKNLSIWINIFFIINLFKINLLIWEEGTDKTNQVNKKSTEVANRNE